MDGPRDYHTQRSKSDREIRMLYITYIWNLKYDTNELIYETVANSQTENKLLVDKGVGVGEGWIGSLGLADAHSYIEQTNNKILLYSTGNYIHYLVLNHYGKQYEKEHICVSLLYTRN